ncbi:type II CAAX prenyl endopeptidase Rce1 family protein [Christiangramia flava]|uniref:CPBP family glutamic-type intramembrane protease n=1 Tax=Christiangramia flava TaxID=1486245 RepID=UPI0009F84027|nr:CPBP family glutamic-type intramembrane protease [Christiangramia flava]
MEVLYKRDLGFKIKNLFRNFGLMIACYILFFFLMGMLNAYFPELDLKQYQQSDLLETLTENPLKFFFLAVILAPVVEESLFRSLLKPSEQNLKLFFCSILYIVGLVLMPENAHWTLKYLLLFLCIAFFYYALGELIPEKLMKKINYWIYRRYLLIWIFSAVIFGFVHIFNYVESFQIDLVLLIMIFPRIIAGFFFGKIKLENREMFWPIALHSLNNLMVFLVMFPILE